MLADRIAKRYASALYQLAVEKNIVSDLHHDFTGLQKLYNESSDFRVFLRSPIITHERKVPILEKMFDGKVHKALLLFIVTLTRRSRENLLPFVATEFFNLYNTAHKITQAELITPRLLEPALKHEIASKLEKALATKVILQESVDPALIGGFQIKIGTALVDTSISNSLRQIRKKLTQNLTN